MERLASPSTSDSTPRLVELDMNSTLPEGWPGSAGTVSTVAVNVVIALSRLVAAPVTVTTVSASTTSVISTKLGASLAGASGAYSTRSVYSPGGSAWARVNTPLLVVPASISTPS